MSREEVVNMCNQGHINQAQVIDVLVDYCKEHGKPEHLISAFISFALQVNPTPFFLEALEYYKRKFTVVTLMGVPDSSGEEKVIKYF